MSDEHTVYLSGGYDPWVLQKERAAEAQRRYLDGLPRAEIKIGAEWVKVPILPPGAEAPPGKFVIPLDPAREGELWRRP